MVTHRPHPIDDDPVDAVLYDRCERCNQHADMLTSLDDRNLTRLYGMVGSDTQPQTAAEAKAMRNLSRVVIVARRLRFDFRRPVPTVAEVEGLLAGGPDSVQFLRGQRGGTDG